MTTETITKRDFSLEFEQAMSIYHKEWRTVWPKAKQQQYYEIFELGQQSNMPGGLDLVALERKVALNGVPDPYEDTPGTPTTRGTILKMIDRDAVNALGFPVVTLSAPKLSEEGEVGTVDFSNIRAYGSGGGSRIGEVKVVGGVGDTYGDVSEGVCGGVPDSDNEDLTFLVKVNNGSAVGVLLVFVGSVYVGTASKNTIYGSVTPGAPTMVSYTMRTSGNSLLKSALYNTTITTILPVTPADGGETSYCVIIPPCSEG